MDNIPHLILKQLPEAIISEICTLFNNMINNEYFPQAWKIAKVVVFPKKGKDSCNIRNFREISLFSNISKNFEVEVNNNILKFSESRISK